GADGVRPRTNRCRGDHANRDGPRRRAGRRRRPGASGSFRARSPRARSDTMIETPKRFWLCAVACAALTPGVAAQERRPNVQSTFEFVAGERFEEAVVRGAPYSAEATTTMTQTLADGTRIERTTYTKVFRDSEGRLRREQTVLGLGALTSTGESATVITIS